MKELAELFRDLGFPVAVVVWLFWRDYMVMRHVEKRLQQVIDLLGVLAANSEEKHHAS